MIELALILVAGLLAAVALFRGKGQDLTAWAVLFLAAALLWSRLGG
jgi:hypothetical protein